MIKLFMKTSERCYLHILAYQGQLFLSSSAHLVRYKNIEKLLKNKKIILKIDFKPALSEEKT